MASKRNLYRPAQVQENVGQRKPRKTLAQGRLITNGTTTQGSVPAARSNHASILSNSQLRKHATSHQHNTDHVTNTSVNSSQLHQTSLVQGRLEESLFSPRRCMPVESEQPRTPDRGPLIGSLDLSDSEMGDESPELRCRHQNPEEVLYIDASRQTVNPDVSEVDIRIGIDRSPVKIVCHSPSRINHSLRQQTNVIDSTDILQHNKFTTPVIQKEIITDDHIDPYTAVQSIPMTPPLADRKVLQSIPSNYPQPNFSDSGGSDILSVDKLPEASDNDNSSVKEYVVTNHKLKDKEQMEERIPSSSKKDKRPETAKKKKKGRTVPSRYMQAAESKLKASLSVKLEKSSIDKTSKASKSLDYPTSVKQSARKVRRPVTRETVPDRPSTPENMTISSTGGKTSTPTMDGSHLSADMDIDASAIHPEISMLAGDTSRLQHSAKGGSGKTRSRLRQDLRDELMGQSILSNVTLSNQSTVSSKPKHKLDAKSMQQRLDMLYMYNLQWAFVEAKAKKSFQDHEKQAMAQIYGLYEEVEKLRKVKSDREQQHARLRHTNVTDNMAEVQRQCLGPVIHNLPTLQKQYSNLAYALDTTRHQIPTKDIHLPENTEQFQAELEAQLLESERLLGEVSAVTRQQCPTIAAMGNAMVTMEQAVESMEIELIKSRELLAATETLTIHECSLRVQELQLLDQS